MPEKSKKSKKAKKGKKSGKKKAQKDSVVCWGETELKTTFKTGRLVTAKVPKKLLAKPGVVAVKVRNPDGNTTNAAYFVIEEKEEEPAAGVE